MAKDPYSYPQTKLQELLRRVRLEAGLRQQDLAKLLGVPQSFVSKYESGERRLDLVEIRQICRAMGMSLSRFVRMFEESLE
ncbi:MAG TPA: helix-turn-helix transcriptional regulator [Phycisphaerae bacterium]|nr:helix-turn-helix transcriptional regulator [Phycisphaerae bacterium]